MDFLELKIAGLLESKNQFFFFSRVPLAILPLPLSLQTFFTTSTMLWERLLQKLRFQLNEKYFF